MIFRFFSLSPSSVGKFFINWSLVRFSSSDFPSLGWEVFHQQHDPLRLINFHTGLVYSQWSPGFPPQFLSSGWEVFHQNFPSTIPCSTELASKKEGNCNNVTFGAESSQSGSHVTTIIQTSPWLVWLLAQRFIKSGSHLKLQLPFLTYAPNFSSYALDFSSLYALEHLCTKPERYFAWVSADYPLVKIWGWIILKHQLVARSECLARRSQTSSLVQLLASISVLVRMYWLNEVGLTPTS